MWSFNGPPRRLQLFRRSRNTLCRPSIQGASHEYQSICASRCSRIGGGLVSTASDYALFLKILRNGGVLGSTRVLDPKTIELMTMNHLLALLSAAGSGEQPGLGGRGGSGFGLGFAVIDQAVVIRRILSHLGLPTEIPAPRPARDLPRHVDVPPGDASADLPFDLGA